jgi:hypothetical protein
MIAAAFVAATVLVFVIVAGRQASAARLSRLAITAAEVQRGSFFAWAQVRSWWPQLSDVERSQMSAACQDWRQSHSTLHWKNEKWPPLSAAKSVLDGGLPWDRICPPAFYSVPLEVVAIEP